MIVTGPDRTVTVTLGDYSQAYTDRTLPPAPPAPKVDDSRLAPGEHYAIAGFSGAAAVACAVGLFLGGGLLLALFAVGFAACSKYFFDEGREAAKEQEEKAKPPAAKAPARVDLQGTMAPGPSAALQPPKAT